MDRPLIRPFSRGQLLHDHHPLRCANGELNSATLDDADSNLHSFCYKQLQQLAPIITVQDTQRQQSTLLTIAFLHLHGSFLSPILPREHKTLDVSQRKTGFRRFLLIERKIALSRVCPQSHSDDLKKPTSRLPQSMTSKPSPRHHTEQSVNHLFLHVVTPDASAIQHPH
ncbi:hypothetical protein D9M69_396200 [compost metagenome]